MIKFVFSPTHIHKQECKVCDMFESSCQGNALAHRQEPLQVLMDHCCIRPACKISAGDGGTLNESFVCVSSQAFLQQMNNRQHGSIL